MFLKPESYGPSPLKYADIGQPGNLSQLNPVQPISAIDLSLHSSAQTILQLWQINGQTYVHSCHQHKIRVQYLWMEIMVYKLERERNMIMQMSQDNNQFYSYKIINSIN
jgi:hypothetical protein